MATGNFYCKNTNSIFAIGMNHYTTQEEIDENGWDQDLLDTFDAEQTDINYQCQKDMAVHLLEQAGWDITDEYDSYNSTTSHSVTTLADKTITKVYAGISIEITMVAQIVSGYYEGACFDLEASLRVYDPEGYIVRETDSYDEIYNIDKYDIISENWQGNLGMTKIHAKGILEALNKGFNDLQNEAENIFKQVAEYRLGVAWQASNGETGYCDLDANNKGAA